MTTHKAFAFEAEGNNNPYPFSKATRTELSTPPPFLPLDFTWCGWGWFIGALEIRCPAECPMAVCPRLEATGRGCHHAWQLLSTVSFGETSCQLLSKNASKSNRREASGKY